MTLANATCKLPEDGVLTPKHVGVFFFNVLLTVHLSIFILVINQLEAQNLFYSKSISCLYMLRALIVRRSKLYYTASGTITHIGVLRAPRAHRQEVKIVLYSLWDHHTYRCDDTRVCIIQF